MKLIVDRIVKTTQTDSSKPECEMKGVRKDVVFT